MILCTFDSRQHRNVYSSRCPKAPHIGESGSDAWGSSGAYTRRQVHEVIDLLSEAGYNCKRIYLFDESKLWVPQNNCVGEDGTPGIVDGPLWSRSRIMQGYNPT